MLNLDQHRLSFHYQVACRCESCQRIAKAKEALALAVAQEEREQQELRGVNQGRTDQDSEEFALTAVLIIVAATVLAVAVVWLAK